MSTSKPAKVRITAYVDIQDEEDFVKFSNGVTPGAAVKALLAIAAKHGEAPFGIYQEPVKPRKFNLTNR